MDSKRNLSQLDTVPHPSKKKKIFSSRKSNLNRIMLYDHYTTPLIRPNTDLILDFRGLFALRSFRLIQGYHTINLPIFDELEIGALLDQLLEHYKKNPHHSNDENSVQLTNKFSKKEQNLLKAKDYLLEKNMNLQQISKFTGLKQTQIKSLSKRLETTGEVLPFTKKKSQKLNEEQVNFITSLLNQKNGCILTLDQIRHELLTHFPIIQSISLKTLSNTLKRQGFTFKKISPIVNRRNFTTNKNEQKKVCQQLITILSQEYNIIFVDETGVKLNCHPRYGWGKKGEKVSLEVQVEKKNFSIMAAITDQQVLGCQIIEEGGVKKDDFLGFLCTVISQCCPPGNFNEIFVFLDNSSTHKSPHITSHLGTQVTFIFNAAYSPMLNPIEEFFSKFKGLIKKDLIKDSSQLITAVQKALTSFTPNDFKGYIRHVLNYASAALNDENLV